MAKGKNMIKEASLVVFAAGLCLAQQPVPPENATISGVVYGADSKALRLATVRLEPPPSEASVPERVTQTDSQGSFEFDEVASGRYLLAVERTGYLNSLYQGPKGPVLTIKSGQTMTGVAMKMTPQSIIAGRVVDDEGEPLPGASVSVGSYSPPEGCRTCVLPGAAGTTDADGTFSIGELVPGRYVVSVAVPPKLAQARKASSSETRQEVYVTTYYPDATDRAASTPIELTAGGQARGLEIKLQKAAVYKVSGRVVKASTGEAVGIDTLSLIRQGNGPPGLSARSVGVGAGGEFSFDAVLPGDYFLEAKSSTNTDDTPALVGWQPIAVGDADLDRVLVEMKPALELSGKIVVEGQPPSAWPQITLTPIDGLNYLDSPMVGSDGRFHLTGLEPESYQLTVGRMPPPLYLKSIRLNGRRIDPVFIGPAVNGTVNGILDVASSPGASLEIVLSQGTLSLSGVVTDSDGPVGPGIFVLASSETLPLQITGTDDMGRFLFKGLPPGQYSLVAMDLPAILPPDVLAKVGTVVDLTDGAASVNLSVNPNLRPPETQ